MAFSHVNNSFRVLNHLDFGNEVGPSIVSKKGCDLSSQAEELVHHWYVDLKTRLVAFICTFASLWVLCEFELGVCKISLQS